MSSSSDHSSSDAETGLQLAVPVMLTLGLLSAVAPLATDTYLPSFPHVVRDLGAADSAVQLTLTLFMVGMGVGQLFWGPVSDRHGRRAPLLWACALFCVAGLSSALSTSIAMLIVSRLVQGFAGAAGPVLGRAIARDLAHGRALASLYSLLAIITGIAPVLAPLLGGVLAGPLGWRGILWMLVGIGIVMLASSAALRESYPLDRRQPGGVRTVLGSATRVLADRPFVGCVLVQAFGVAVLFAFISASSLVLQSQYGLGPITYSLLFALNAVALIAGGIINNRIVARHAPAAILRVALIVSMAASLAAAVVSIALRQPPLWILLPAVAAASLCNSGIMANTTTLGLERHPDNAGMASAVMGAAMSTLSGAISQFVSLGGTASAISMTVVMATSALFANLAFHALCRRADFTA